MLVGLPSGAARDVRLNCWEQLHQWSQPSNPTATCAQRAALSLAVRRQSQNRADHVSNL